MLRVGSVPYLVGRPLDLGLAEEPGIELVHAVPARLVTGLRDGSLDVALVSSIELFRRPGYRYLDGLGVAGRGEVSSVQVFLRRPLARVRTLALDPASRTAQALTRTLWPTPETRFLELEPGCDPAAAEADAWLRIGDPALEDLRREPERPRWNPSLVWRETTGLPFVFAPWIVRPGAAVAPHLSAFARSARRGREARARLAQEAAESPEHGRLLHAYLEDECLFEPGETMGPSLAAFRDRAAALELCLAEAAPQPIALPAN